VESEPTKDWKKKDYKAFVEKSTKDWPKWKREFVESEPKE
jgi:hypothetical protein